MAGPAKRGAIIVRAQGRQRIVKRLPWSRRVTHKKEAKMQGSFKDSGV
jgi:hypothetical protein